MKIPWRRLKFLALGLGLVIGLGLIYWAVANARAAARVAEKIAALRAAGEPTSLMDLRREPIPPETNAMTYLDQAAPAAKAMVSAVDDVEEKATEEEQNAFEENRPSPAILAAMREALAAHPEVMPLIERAAACPDFDPQLDYSAKTHDFLVKAMQERFSALRNVWRVLRYRALVQLADGQRDDALRTCLLMFRLARHADQQPLLLNFLVTTALRLISIRVTETVLYAGPVATELRTVLEEELGRQDLAHSWREASRSDRAYGTEYFHEMAEGPMGMTYRQLPMFKNDQCDYLDLLDFCIQTSDRPFADEKVQDELARVEREAGTLTRLMLPALNATRVSRFRTETLLHALRMLNAIQRREQAGEVNEPRLDELGLPAVATRDPVNGEPLQIKKTPQGWLIYGVGTNLKDDGGQLRDLSDFGIGPK